MPTNEKQASSSAFPITTAVGAAMSEAVAIAGWNSESLQFKISEDAETKVLFRGRVTQEAIDKLVKLLQLSKDTYPKARIAATDQSAYLPLPRKTGADREGEEVEVSGGGSMG